MCVGGTCGGYADLFFDGLGWPFGLLPVGATVLEGGRAPVGTENAAQAPGRPNMLLLLLVVVCFCRYLYPKNMGPWPHKC